jgi:hypothetical protein
MKKTITLLLLTLINLAFTQVPNYVPTNNLKGWWPFNGNANDASGNGNNGTPNGTSLTADRNGITNSAYNFDGVNDKIGLGNFFNYTTFTISLWVKPGNQNGHAVIIDNNHSGSNNWVFQTISNFSNNGYNFQNSNLVLLSTSNWNHVILSYSLGFVRVYLNSSLVSETQMSLNYNSTPSLFLGYWQVDNARFWKGDMDDIGIWNRALTQTEITALYTGVLSSESFKNKSSFKMYTNKENDVVQFKSTEMVERISIYNALGQLVQENKTNSLEGAISIEHLAQGSYFVKVNNQNTSYTLLKK